MYSLVIVDHCDIDKYGLQQEKMAGKGGKKKIPSSECSRPASWWTPTKVTLILDEPETQESETEEVAAACDMEDLSSGESDDERRLLQELVKERERRESKNNVAVTMVPAHQVTSQAEVMLALGLKVVLNLFVYDILHMMMMMKC